MRAAGKVRCALFTGWTVSDALGHLGRLRQDTWIFRPSTVRELTFIAAVPAWPLPEGGRLRQFRVSGRVSSMNV